MNIDSSKKLKGIAIPMGMDYNFQKRKKRKITLIFIVFKKENNETQPPTH
jgi:hypothetical protein